jgi:SAM-dependent methyltransferase
VRSQRGFGIFLPLADILGTTSLHNPLCAQYTSLPMSSIGDKYLLGSGRSDHDRLRVISAIHDGRTRELLRKAGFTSGHRFVEFGCGLGYVTRWAASEGAHATGIDLNEDNLAVATDMAREAGLKTAEFRSANIYEPGLPPESVDVSYSRWLMVHLNRPVDAMRAIHAALKPGGVMVCEEADVSAVYAEPPSAAYNELRDICMEGARQRGVDYAGGRRAHLWAQEAGFEIVHVDAYHPHYVTGEHKGFWNWTLRAVALGMVAEGTLTSARLEELVAGMNEADASQDTLVAHCRMHQLIAKKPA